MTAGAGSSGASGLVGRAEERRRLTRSDRGAAAVLLSGEAGIGKSALLDDAVATAAAEGCLTLTSRASGGGSDDEVVGGLRAPGGLAWHATAESSGERPFGVLVDLLGPVDLDGLGLSDPVRSALEVATLRASRSGPIDPLAVEVGTWQALRALGLHPRRRALGGSSARRRATSS